MSRHSFIFGAAVLMAANIIAKALGAVFKIPLAYVLGEYGMAVYNTAFSVYVMALSLVSAGFPVAVSKGISVRCGNGVPTSGFMKNSRLIFLLFGALGSAVLYFGAGFFSIAMREPDAVISVRVLAPGIFLVAWGNVYKCFYQGCADMIPTAVSQVIEAVVKLPAGIGLAMYFSRYGAAAAAAGALAGVVGGEFIASLVLRVMYRQGVAVTTRLKEDFNEIAVIAIPLMFAALASNLLTLADITTLRLRLAQIVFDADAAARLSDTFRHAFTFSGEYLSQKSVSWLYGAYSGYASVLFNLPCGIIATLGVSLFPLTARAAQNNPERLSALTNRGAELAAALSVPCAVILFFFSRPALILIFRNGVSAPLLSLLACSLYPLCTSNVLVNIMYSAGCIYRPFFCSLAASAVKLAVIWVLAGDIRFNIAAAPISLIVYAVVVFILNVIGIQKKFGLRLSLTRILFRPLFCGAVMAYTCILVKNSPIADMFLPVSLVVSVFIVMGVYTVLFFLTGGKLNGKKNTNRTDDKVCRLV